MSRPRRAGWCGGAAGSCSPVAREHAVAIHGAGGTEGRAALGARPGRLECGPPGWNSAAVRTAGAAVRLERADECPAARRIRLVVSGVSRLGRSGRTHNALARGSAPSTPGRTYGVTPRRSAAPSTRPVAGGPTGRGCLPTPRSCTNKLQRIDQVLARDVFDILTAADENPAALATAANMVSKQSQRQSTIQRRPPFHAARRRGSGEPCRGPGGCERGRPAQSTVVRGVRWSLPIDQSEALALALALDLAPVLPHSDIHDMQGVLAVAAQGVPRRGCPEHQV